MRRIDRSPFETPKFLESPEFQELRRDLAATHDRAAGGRRGKQRDISFERLFAPFRDEATQALHPVFAGKCAYTERPADPEAPLHFHLHRPGGDAVGLDGSVAPEHYWWLQTRWENWMLASEQVVSLKGTSFPVVGDRLEPEDPGAVETALLIDPTQEEPAWWLEFLANGEVRPRSIASAALNDRFGAEYDRGAVNIRLLDLHQGDLVEGRRKALASVSTSRVRELLARDGLADFEAWLDQTLAPSTPFLGALRQRLGQAVLERVPPLPPANERGRLVLERLAPEVAAYLCAYPERVEAWHGLMSPNQFQTLLGPALDLALETCPDLEPQLLPSRKVTAPATEKALREDTTRGGTLGRTRGLPDLPDLPDLPLDGAYSVGAAPAATEPEKPSSVKATPVYPPIERSARLREIRIRNFKAIEDLTLTIPDGVVTVRTGPLSDPKERISAVNWKMLLGENACGKSSILQAIALALYGPEIEKDPPVPVKDFRRRGTGNRQSSVQLTFRGHDQPVHLKLNRSGFKYVWKPDFQTFVRAYGATRLFRSDVKEGDLSPAAERRRIGNLLDPMFPVIDVERWLLSIDDGDFNVAARALRELIAGVGEVQDPTVLSLDLERDLDHGTVRLGGDTLQSLSDGYRSLLALTCDIMAGLGSGLSDMENAVGIVLIDEIGAHLHPRLRMQVVPRLRYIFPQIQFLCSTHEPLCLRGLFEEEVDRIRRDAEGVQQETIPRSPSNYRVDQLLTSEFFGLETTLDPEIDGEFQHYYHLLSRPELTPEEAALRDRLRRRLVTEGVLGYTRRDQLVYQAIDEYLADPKLQSASVSPQAKAQLKEATLKRVKDIWSYAELKQLGGDRRDDQG
jgi:hypothetical protein